MNENQTKFILEAKAKALATFGNHGINVVPVSTIFIVDNKIWLINYFMNKTEGNIRLNNHVALAVWTDMSGYQIKGVASYFESGELFNRACELVAAILPDRVVKGLIEIKIEEIHDISPTKDSDKFFTKSGERGH